LSVTSSTVARDRFLKVDGMRLRVRRQGTGTPMLLINGLGACLDGWEPLAERLAGRDLIMVDHPGTGRSQTPQRALSMAEIAKLYVSVLDRLGVDRFDVLGFSFGGTVAQQIARDFPRRVTSLVLAGTSCGLGGVPADPFTLFVASNPMRYQFAAVREFSAPFIYRGRVGRCPELFETELKGWQAHKADLSGVYYQVAAFSRWSSLPWLWTLRVPTLVLGGSEDPMAPAVNSHLLAALIPGAQLHIVKAGGHLFPFDRAKETAERIDDFLSRVHPVVAAA
jgi:poly(3-hydroxyoctanoate) depolymerase